MLELRILVGGGDPGVAESMCHVLSLIMILMNICIFRESVNQFEYGLLHNQVTVSLSGSECYRCVYHGLKFNWRYSAQSSLSASTVVNVFDPRHHGDMQLLLCRLGFAACDTLPVGFSRRKNAARSLALYCALAFLRDPSTIKHLLMFKVLRRWVESKRVRVDELAAVA